MAIATLALFAVASPQDSGAKPLSVPGPSGPVLVEAFAKCGRAACPAIIVLSGSKGFGAPVYKDLAAELQSEGLAAYLIHALSPADVAAIASAKGAHARIAYYRKQLPHWIGDVNAVAAYLRKDRRHRGVVGLLGISLGAQLAAATADSASSVDAIVLVDGGLPSDHHLSGKTLPPTLLIWGDADKVFPPRVGRQLQSKLIALGGSAEFTIFNGGAHDFFLQAQTSNAKAAHQRAAKFLTSKLAQ